MQSEGIKIQQLAKLFRNIGSKLGWVVLRIYVAFEDLHCIIAVKSIANNMEAGHIFFSLKF